MKVLSFTLAPGCWLAGIASKVGTCLASPLALLGVVTASKAGRHGCMPSGKSSREARHEAQLVLTLQEAVASVSIGQGVVVNPEVEHQAQLWMEGLLAQDKVRARPTYSAS